MRNPSSVTRLPYDAVAHQSSTHLPSLRADPLHYRWQNVRCLAHSLSVMALSLLGLHDVRGANGQPQASSGTGESGDSADRAYKFVLPLRPIIRLQPKRDAIPPETSQNKERWLLTRMGIRSF